MASFSNNAVKQLYDALDKGDFKRGLKLCKKHKRPTPEMRALEAHALERTGKREDALKISQSLLEGLSRTAVPEWIVCSHLAMVLRNLGRDDLVTQVFLVASSKASPDLESYMINLFLAYGRESKYLEQQRTAMKMARQFKKPQYSLWNATAMVLQVETKATDKGPLLLTMATRILLKALETFPKDSGQASELYIYILEKQGNFKGAIEAMTTLADPASGRLKSSSMLPVERLKLLSRLHKQVGTFEAAQETLKSLLLTVDSDDWNAYESLIDLTMEECKSEVDPVAASEKLKGLHSFFQKVQREVSEERRARGPVLAFVALEHAARTFRRSSGSGGQESWEVVMVNGQSVELGDTSGAHLLEKMVTYIGIFGTKTCCFSDLRKYLSDFTENSDGKVSDEVRGKFLQYLRELGKEHELKDEGKNLEMGIARKHVYTYTLVNQLLVYLGYVGNEQELVESLVRQWSLSLKYNPGSGETEAAGKAKSAKSMREVQCGDTLMLMATNILMNVASKSESALGRRQHLLEALGMLHYGLEKSPYNFQLKLSALKCYESIAVFMPAISIFSTLKTKHIQLDTLSHLIFDCALNSGNTRFICSQSEQVQRFHIKNERDLLDASKTAFRHNNVMQIFEFMKFKNMMSRSHRRCRAMVEIAYREIFLDHTSFKDQQAFIALSVGGAGESNKTSTSAVFNTSASFLDNLEMTEDDGVRLSFRPETDENSNEKLKRVSEVKKIVRYLKVMFALEKGELSLIDSMLDSKLAAGTGFEESVSYNIFTGVRYALEKDEGLSGKSIKYLGAVVVSLGQNHQLSQEALQAGKGTNALHDALLTPCVKFIKYCFPVIVYCLQLLISKKEELRGTQKKNKIKSGNAGAENPSTLLKQMNLVFDNFDLYLKGMSNVFSVEQNRLSEMKTSDVNAAVGFDVAEAVCKSIVEQDARYELVFQKICDGQLDNMASMVTSFDSARQALNNCRKMLKNV